ncbi:MAG: hypothetical protein JRJ03_08725 [Deltaproteobacteria bacterium]|nr:hypothetical protein [Deltaproteobacteria bacterium]
MSSDDEIIVGLGEVAKVLQVSKQTARRILERCKTPLLEAYKPRIAVFRSELMDSVKKAKE